MVSSGEAELILEVVSVDQGFRTHFRGDTGRRNINRTFPLWEWSDQTVNWRLNILDWLERGVEQWWTWWRSSRGAPWGPLTGLLSSVTAQRHTDEKRRRVMLEPGYASGSEALFSWKNMSACTCISLALSPMNAGPEMFNFRYLWLFALGPPLTVTGPSAHVWGGTKSWDLIPAVSRVWPNYSMILLLHHPLCMARQPTGALNCH